MSCKSLFVLTHVKSSVVTIRQAMFENSEKAKIAFGQREEILQPSICLCGLIYSFRTTENKPLAGSLLVAIQEPNPASLCASIDLNRICSCTDIFNNKLQGRSVHISMEHLEI